MRNHIHRVLSQYHLSPAQWAILFAASYYLPAPVHQFVNEAQLEANEDFTIDQLSDAFDECLKFCWICSADETRMHAITDDTNVESAQDMDKGIVLTDAGNELKETVSRAILETVEID